MNLVKMKRNLKVESGRKFSRGIKPFISVSSLDLDVKERYTRICCALEVRLCNRGRKKDLRLGLYIYMGNPRGLLGKRGKERILNVQIESSEV